MRKKIKICLSAVGIVCTAVIAIAGFLLWYTSGAILLKGKMLTLEWIMYDSLRVNPQKDKIIFSVYGVKRIGIPTSDIFIIDLRSGVAEQVTKNGASNWPSWLDDENIVFESLSADVFNLLNLMNIRTKERTRLETNVFIFSYTLSVALNGRAIIFEGDIMDKANNITMHKLYFYDLQKNKVMEIIDIRQHPLDAGEDYISENFDKHPFISQASPSSKEVIFYKDSTFYGFDLMSKTKNILFKEENVVDFDYDRSKIIISKRIAGGKYRMAIKDLKKDKETIIIQGDKIYNRPRWSPSGKFIAYHAGKDVWIYDTVTQETSKLTEGNMYSYTWITDDELVIQRGRVELYKISRDGKNLQQIFPPGA